MKRMCKILLIIFMLVNINVYCYAEPSYTIFETASNFLNIGETEADSDSQELDYSGFNRMIDILRAIGIVVAVVIGAVLGIKYMIASVQERSEIHKQLIIYVLGCVVAFGAVAIWEAIVNTLNAAI